MNIFIVAIPYIKVNFYIYFVDLSYLWVNLAVESSYGWIVRRQLAIDNE